jgi:hypothetical protein
VRAQQAASAQIDALGHAGEQAGKAATAMKNAGDMAASLKHAGLE